MISDVLGMEPLERRINGEDTTALLQALQTDAPHRLIYDHFDFDLHGAILTPAKYPRLKLVLLYRHPVDALISQFYTRAGKGTLPDPSLSVIDNLKRYIGRRSKPGHDGIPLRDYVRRKVVGWLISGTCLSVRYESLVQDTGTQLEQVLNYLEIPWTADIIQKAVEQNDFRVLSGGRRPGEVDPASHYRRGLPGEWREVLTSNEVADLHEQIGDYLEILGYPTGYAA
jgi:hypothetical protein